MLNVFVFPGQGTQRAGMIRLLAPDQMEEVRDIFEMASDISHRDVLDLCTNQPDQVLAQTQNTQVCVTAMNLCFLKLLTSHGVKPDVVLGQSLGQFSAVAASGSMSFENTFRLVCERARMMAELKSDSILDVCLGITLDRVKEGISKVPGVEIALVNSETQIVLGGTREKLEQAAVILKEMGAFKVEAARVDHAFHTSYMQGMEAEYCAFMDSLPVSQPMHRIILNCSAKIAGSVQDVIDDIKKQCCHTVLWNDSLKLLYSLGEMKIAEVGAGKTMAGIIRNTGYKEKVYLMSERRDFMTYTR